MIEIKQLVQMSKYAGERFDLVQAGGGNSSVKLSGGKMIIKASGYNLSEINESKGISRVDNHKILYLLDKKELVKLTKLEREKRAVKAMEDANLTPKIKASIETFLHALTQKYTLHTHPIVVNIIACRDGWNKTFSRLFPDALFVHYETPGISLAIQMKLSLDRYIAKYKANPQIIFLQNHGIIITSNSLKDIFIIMENVVLRLEKSLGIDYSAYRMTNKVSQLVNNVIKDNKIAYLSTDISIIEILRKYKNILSCPPFCPDKMVYCGASNVELKNQNDVQSIKKYVDKYEDYPKIIILNKMIFIIADSVRKAKEIEDIFKFHLVVIKENKGHNINYLSMNELDYLNNWESEKYRQKL